MPSAAELLYTRRSRVGRITDSDDLGGGFDSSLDRISLHNNNRRQHHHHTNNFRGDRHDLDGCDHLRRPPNLRHPIHRTVHIEHESVRHDQISSQSTLGNSVNSENFSSIRERQRFRGNDRLPGAVLLARERLLNRLRDVSLSANRRSNSASSLGVRFNDVFRLGDVGDWQTEAPRNWLAGYTAPTYSISPTDRQLVLQEPRKRPPGLTQEALNGLPLEVFTIKKSDEEAVSMAPLECSICLESFLEGDELRCLPCGHKFHSSCLYPWVQTCGDCPYCRTDILVDRGEQQESHSILY
ncbi:unnamed protein product [Ilex paraguariensis]|uniref:RING-type domain-containing protein n=1 Tax=Ilex paraguariensis TaxID=185542 RepID=A0ABC8UJD5_9AQUA